MSLHPKSLRGDAELRRHIDKLVQAEAKLGGFLARPLQGLEATADAAPLVERPGTVIGPLPRVGS